MRTLKKEKKKNDNEDIKTLVHKTQFFYLFVSRPREEIHTQTIDTHVYAHIHTHIDRDLYSI